MARLNEAPVASTENIDSLKRRFIRQNRELAKTNSTQCLRIRALECDVSRLLSENLDLREQILGLQASLTDAESRVGATCSIKERLDARLHDFGALVAELGELQHKSLSSISPRPSPHPESWRPEVPIAALSGQSQRMSIIDEESIHRHQQHSVRLSDQSNESPDIGPPPIAHFDYDDPIAFDHDKSAIRQEPPVESDEQDTLPPSLSVNLETRKKRRETGIKQDVVPLLSPNKAADSAQLNKPGTKRKLSIMDAEDSNLLIAKDEFVFSRKPTGALEGRRPTTGKESNALEPSNTNQTPLADDPVRMPPQNERRVLGIKSVNMSPRKEVDRESSSKVMASGPGKPLKNSGKGPARERRPRTSTAAQVVCSDPVIESIELRCSRAEISASMPPKTPALALFSPSISEPSVTRNETRDTPPPAAFNSARSAASEVHGASRPSRRARAAVNYAEPNLISKMRRPDKTLADAVTMNSRRSSSHVPESEIKKHGRTDVIKQEEEEDDESAWRALRPSIDEDHTDPASPLNNKRNANSRQVEQRRIDSDPKGCNASDPPKDMDASLEITTRRLQEMDLYNFTSTSPEPIVPKKGDRRRSTIVTAAGRDDSKRRVSKVQAPMSSPETSGHEEVQAEPRRDRTRRRSMMV